MSIQRGGGHIKTFPDLSKTGEKRLEVNFFDLYHGLCSGTALRENRCSDSGVMILYFGATFHG